MLIGCSLLPKSSDKTLDEQQLVQQQQEQQSSSTSALVSPNSSLAPLPVEIADDISRLKAGQQLAPGGWKPIAPPTGDRNPSVDGGQTGQVNAEGDDKAGLSGNIAEPGAANAPTVVAVNGHSSGKNEKYVVKPGDTLMKISFAKYGNVYRWREIYNANKPVIADYNELVKGTVLNIHGVEYVVIEKNGQPYLIRRADTLVKISKGLYGTSAEWKNLWHNNPHLIHNPNKIYTGFTMYYVPRNKEELRQPTAVKPASMAPSIPEPIKN